MKNANANLMKEINLGNVRQAMRQAETATKPQLASLTKLSVVTVNSLVKELLERGEIVEDQMAPSSGGRPAAAYRYNYDYSLALIISIRERQGQELMTATVINLEDRPTQQEELIMPVFDRELLYAMIGRVLASYPAIKIIGIGIPGQVVQGEITVSSHRELTGVRMVEELETRFGLPVIVENDVNAATVGYCARQESADDASVVGIYFPGKYPPGMGIYLDGKLVKGKHGMAGEIKFLPFSLDWHHQMDEAAFAAAVCHIIQTINAVLAPDQVIIYQERLTAGQLDEAWALYQSQQPMAVQPDVIPAETFQADFEAGMRWLTLKEL